MYIRDTDKPYYNRIVQCATEQLADLMCDHEDDDWTRFIPAVFERSIDRERSMRICVDIYTRNLTDVSAALTLMSISLNHVRHPEQASVILDMRQSVKSFGAMERYYSNYVPERIVALVKNPSAWAAAGARTTRASPSDRSLVGIANFRNYEYLLAEGESPDNPDGTCEAVKRVSHMASAIHDSSFFTFLSQVVWFSDLPLDRLLEDVHKGYLSKKQWEAQNRFDVVDRQVVPKNELLSTVSWVTAARDVIRPLVDYRRHVVLDTNFRDSSLRHIPPHLTKHILEFILSPVVCKPWIKSWYCRK